MFVTFGQPKGFKQLYQFSKSLRDISKKMLERAKTASNFGKSLLMLMKIETPKYSIYFEPITKEYEKLSISYATSAKILYFAMEDLNDIIVRFPVLQRKESEKVKLIQAYNSSNKKYKEAKLLFKKSDTQENNWNLIKTRNDRALLAEKLIEKSDECVSYQARFDRFVQNRSTSAWKRYSLSVEKLCREEAEIMDRLISYCSHFKENIDNPEKIISKIEEMNNSLKINKSSPALIKNPVHLTNQNPAQSTNQNPVHLTNQNPTQSANQNPAQSTNQNPTQSTNQNPSHLTNQNQQQDQKEQQIELSNKGKNEDFQRLTESMQLDIKGGFDLTGIDFSSSDGNDDDNKSDNSINEEAPVDLNINNLDEDELIRDLLESK